MMMTMRSIVMRLPSSEKMGIVRGTEHVPEDEAQACA